MGYIDRRRAGPITRKRWMRKSNTTGTRDANRNGHRSNGYSSGKRSVNGGSILAGSVTNSTRLSGRMLPDIHTPVKISS
jgi:hypothetical protein